MSKITNKIILLINLADNQFTPANEAAAALEAAKRLADKHGLSVDAIRRSMAAAESREVTHHAPKRVGTSARIDPRPVFDRLSVNVGEDGRFEVYVYSEKSHDDGYQTFLTSTVTSRTALRPEVNALLAKLGKPCPARRR